MPIAREILSMFELGRKPSQVILVPFLHRKKQKSQRLSVPTDRQTLLMHRYLQSQGFRRSVDKPLYFDDSKKTECALCVQSVKGYNLQSTI